MAIVTASKGRDNVYDLGAWVGRRQAFSTLAGSCSAADAECIRQLRDRKQYRELGMTWREFCQKRLGVDRKTAEQVIQRLEEFGPQYFTLAQITGVTPAEYRRIATSVSERGLQYAGETIPFAGENAPRLIEAVGKLAEQTAPARTEPNMGETERLLTHCEKTLRAAVDEVRRAYAQSDDFVFRGRLLSIIVLNWRRMPVLRGNSARSPRQQGIPGHRIL